MITAENAPILQSLFNTVNRDKPSEGRTVRVINSRKHFGKVGIVKKHMLSQYEHPFRYGSSMQHHMTQARGRSGYVVLIETFDGDTFWCPAKNTMVCCEKEWD